MRSSSSHRGQHLRHPGVMLPSARPDGVNLIRHVFAAAEQPQPAHHGHARGAKPAHRKRAEPTRRKHSQLALVLVFIGTKIFLVGFIGKFPPAISLAVTFGLIAGGMLVSMWRTRGQPTPMPTA